MDETVKFGVGFITGRPNVCKIINTTYEQLVEQSGKFDKKIELTIFILFDLSYQYTTRVDFYGLIPKVYKNIKIKYITPEDIEEEKKSLIGRGILKRQEAEMFFGYGYAKARNTLLYNALINKMDHFLFWDDDEYPAACIKNEDGTLEWIGQDNIIKHIEYMENADVTFGYRCGYNSPIPYMDLENPENEKVFRPFVDAVGNEFLTYDKLKDEFKKNDGVTYADPEIINGKGACEIEEVGGGKWVAGSPLCLNLRHLENIPAFYNPEGARGEDAFFSTLLKNSKVVRVPVYHFHDPFLKYTRILRKKYPKTLDKMCRNNEEISRRFEKAARGWIKYRPLYLYIVNQKNYTAEIEKTRENLQKSVSGMNQLFADTDFTPLFDELELYHNNVKKDYSNYNKVNEIWNKLKSLKDE